MSIRRRLFLVRLFVVELVSSLVCFGLVPLLVVLGLAVLLDLLGCEQTPPSPKRLSKQEYLLILQSNPCVEQPDSDPWGRLQHPLALLRAVVPEAAAWVHQQHEYDRIVYEAVSPDYTAAYNPVLRTLYVPANFFDEALAWQAAILAHEFYHSCQGWTCRFKATLTCLVHPPYDRTSHVEAPAYAYTDLVYDAITRNAFR